MNACKLPSQSGNAFMMVLIGVILFGALAFTFARSGRQGISNVSAREADITAGDILSYARHIEQGISRMRVKGVSESDLDFLGAGAAYDNAGCAIPKCEVFNPAGGQQAWQDPPGKANDGSAWAFTGNVNVAGIGKDAADDASADLVMFLPNVNPAVCVNINNKLGITNPADAPPSSTGGVDYSAKYTGTFAAGNALSAAEIDGKSAACYEDGGSYHFYQVLLAR